MQSKVTVRRKLRNCAISRYHSNESSSVNTLHDIYVSYVVAHEGLERSSVSVCRVCSASVDNIRYKSGPFVIDYLCVLFVDGGVKRRPRPVIL
jgi:hypothetical protein